MKNSVLVLLLAASPAAASPYAGLGAAATLDSVHPAWMAGYRAGAWRAELGGHLLDRERGKTLPTGSLGATITAERYDLRTRLFYADLSWRLTRRESAEPSGLEFGFGAALQRIVKDTRIERNGGLGEIYSHDTVWRTHPVMRIAYVKPLNARVELGLDARYILTGDRHGGKRVGGWNFSLNARFFPLAR